MSNEAEQYKYEEFIVEEPTRPVPYESVAAITARENARRTAARIEAESMARAAAEWRAALVGG